jgi:hypothetical protein
VRAGPEILDKRVEEFKKIYEGRCFDFRDTVTSARSWIAKTSTRSCRDAQPLAFADDHLGCQAGKDVFVESR